MIDHYMDRVEIPRVTITGSPLSKRERLQLFIDEFYDLISELQHMHDRVETTIHRLESFREELDGRDTGIKQAP